MEEQEVVRVLNGFGIKVDRVDGEEIVCFCPVHKGGLEKSPSFSFNKTTEKFNCFVGCLKGRGLHQLAFQLNKQYDDSAPTPLSRQKKIESSFNLPHIPNLPIALDNPGEKYLISRGLSKDSIVKWNLLYWSEENAVVIPIEDVGYIKRSILKKEYKTLPGTKVGSVLFGASNFNPLKGSAILVEGSFDCIAMHQKGFDNTLALLHADLTGTQYKILQGLASKVYIMLDGDEPGREAAKKVRKTLSNAFIVKVVSLPEGKDPDNLDRTEVLSLLNKADELIGGLKV